MRAETIKNATSAKMLRSAMVIDWNCDYVLGIAPSRVDCHSKVKESLRKMKPLPLLCAAMLLTAPTTAHAENGVTTPTFCMAWHYQINGNTVPLDVSRPAQTLSRFGYRPAPCSKAQIRISLSITITGDTRENAIAKVVADGTNGTRRGHYQKEIPARQLFENRDEFTERVSIALYDALYKIDPEFRQRLINALANANGTGQKP